MSPRFGGVGDVGVPVPHRHLDILCGQLLQRRCFGCQLVSHARRLQLSGRSRVADSLSRLTDRLGWVGMAVGCWLLRCGQDYRHAGDGPCARRAALSRRYLFHLPQTVSAAGRVPAVDYQVRLASPLTDCAFRSLRFASPLLTVLSVRCSIHRPRLALLRTVRYRVRLARVLPSVSSTC